MANFWTCLIFFDSDFTNVNSLLQISTPASHGEKNEKEKEFIVRFCKNNMILALHCDTNIHQKSALCIMICSKQEGHHQKRVITCLDMFWHVAVYMQISFHFSNALDVVSLEKMTLYDFLRVQLHQFCTCLLPSLPYAEKNGISQILDLEML